MLTGRSSALIRFAFREARRRETSPVAVPWERRTAPARAFSNGAVGSPVPVNFVKVRAGALRPKRIHVSSQRMTDPPGNIITKSRAFFVFPLQAGEDPVIKPDDEYPEWLFSLGELSGLGELQAKGVENLTAEEKKRYYQLRSTQQIKERNEIGG